MSPIGFYSGGPARRRSSSTPGTTVTGETVGTAAVRTGWGRPSCGSERSYDMGKKATIRLKRAYEEPSEGDGTRFLVERLWPRGVRKEAAAIDVWLKEVAPSAGLRKWYGHDPDKWNEFRKRYWAELDDNGEVLDDLKRRLGEGPVTFIFAARDEELNSARVLKEYLERDPRS
jgi:uncharacterized protein YeaO (DUF488 family)